MTGLHAFVDESLSHTRLDPNVCILAAAVCEPADEEDLRLAMRKLLLPGQRKVHWRDESDRRREAIAKAIAVTTITNLIVVRAGQIPVRPERRRRLTMERLIHELVQRGVDNVTMESRGKADDARDRALLDSLRAKKLITAPLRMDHRRGAEDALLWAADAACGAVTQDRTGNGTYLQILGASVTLLTIE